jgi:hypothetical protein
MDDQKLAKAYAVLAKAAEAKAFLRRTIDYETLRRSRNPDRAIERAAKALFLILDHATKVEWATAMTAARRAEWKVAVEDATWSSLDQEWACVLGWECPIYTYAELAVKAFIAAPPDGGTDSAQRAPQNSPA